MKQGRKRRMVPEEVESAQPAAPVRKKPGRKPKALAAPGDVPVVARRNDPTSLEPYARSQSTKAEKQDPRFAYEWFRADQLEEKLRRHEIGEAATGFLMVDPWEHVTDSEGIELGRGPAADGKPLDTRIRKGDLWLLKTPKENHAKYAVIERKRDEIIDRRISGGESHRIGSVKIKSRAIGGRNGYEADAADVLQGVA